MTTLFIHIGTWKTGSSTIQYNLYKLRSELEQEGYFYLAKENKLVINDGVIRNFTDLESNYIQQSREKFKRIFDEQIKKNSDIIFISSAEEFSGNPFNGFKNAKAVARNLFEITKNFDLDIYIIVYLRRQDDFFESLYQQSIRLGESHGFQDFLKEFDESDFNWYSLLNAYANVFGKEKIIVRRYNDKYLPNKNSLIQDFGKVIGSKVVSEYDLTTSRNKGYSRDTLEITRIMNKYFDGEERHQLRKLYDKATSRSPFEKYTYFTNSERSAFLDRYKDTNVSVVKEFLNEDEESLFPPPELKNNYSVYKGLSNEEMVVNFSKALLHIKEQSELKNKKLSEGLKKKFLRFKLRKKITRFFRRFPGLKKSLKKFL